MRLLSKQAEVEPFIEIFRQGKSVHIEVAKLIFPEDVSSPDFKKTDKYRWTKNFNFSVSYGAGREKADATAHVEGAYDLLLENYPEVRNFQTLLTYLKSVVRKQGYIETMGGYPLVVPAKKPYAVLNYFVQGSAGIVMKRAMLRCDEWIAANPDRDVRMSVTVHDELVFDLPFPEKSWENDLTFQDTVAKLCVAMEAPGHDSDFQIPLPVEPELHLESWAQGIDISHLKEAA